MSIFSNNLRFLRVQKGLNLDEFAFLGIKKGTMSNYELGKTEPKFDILLALSKFFGISVDDFLTKSLEELDANKGKVKGKEEGKVSPENALENGKTNGTENDSSNGYQNGYFDGYPTPLFLPESGKTKSTNIIELPVVKSDNADMIGVPVVDISVAAGYGFENPDYLTEVDAIYFPKSMIHNGKNYLCVRIKGESMAPTLQDGGYLVIRLLDRTEWQYIREGYVYVVSDREGRAYVKRLKNRFEKGFIVCRSDNPDVIRYPSFNLYENEINTIWYAEWYVSAKMPNIHATFYTKVDDLENKYDDVLNQLQQVRRDIQKLSRRN